MCGRFTLVAGADEVAAHFHVRPGFRLTPRYNAAPGQPVAVVGRKATGERGLALLRWGLVPRWAAAPTGPRPINARAETAAVSPAFRHSFRDRRCLLPADGFLEWQRAGGRRVPHHFRPRGGGLVAFAGLWDVWGRGADRLHTCCLLTTAAAAAVRPVHDRMPVVLPPDRWDRWLDPGTPPAEVAALLQPDPAADLEVVAVSPLVNSVRNDRPECLQPAA